MKIAMIAFFSATILAHGASVHAEGIFTKAFGTKLKESGETNLQFVALETDATASAAGVQRSSVTTESNIQQVAFCDETGCETGCESVCDSGCNSWFGENMRAGTGAFGGDSRVSATLGFNQDTFFGNYTTVAAGYAVNEKVDVTFYSILWHTDFFSQGPGGLNGVGIDGTGLWTEFGGGLNFKLMDGNLNVNPQFGILNGALLSSGGGTNDPVVFDGFVPNLTANYGDGFYQSQLYAGYYIGARGADQNDFVHWWYNAGIQPWGECNNWKSTLSMGLHYEMLAQTAPGPADNLYQWIGPYFQVALPNGLTMRYSAGTNVDDGVGLGNDFYKVNVGYSF